MYWGFTITAAVIAHRRFTRKLGLRPLASSVDLDICWHDLNQRAVYSVIYTGGLDRRNTCEDTIVHTTANECRGPCISIGLYFWECAFIGRKFLSSYEVVNFWKSHLTSADPCDFRVSRCVETRACSVDLRWASYGVDVFTRKIQNILSWNSHHLPTNSRSLQMLKNFK